MLGIVYVVYLKSLFCIRYLWDHFKDEHFRVFLLLQISCSVFVTMPGNSRTCLEIFEYKIVVIFLVRNARECVWNYPGLITSTNRIFRAVKLFKIMWKTNLTLKVKSSRVYRVYLILRCWLLHFWPKKRNARWLIMFPKDFINHNRLSFCTS